MNFKKLYNYNYNSYKYLLYYDINHKYFAVFRYNHIYTEIINICNILNFFDLLSEKCSQDNP